MSASVSLYFDSKGNCPIFTKFGMNVISLESAQTFFFPDSVVRNVYKNVISPALEWKGRGDT